MTITEGDMLFCTPHTIIKNNNYDKDFECIALCISDHIVQGLLRDKADLWHRSVYTNQHNIIHLAPPEQEEFRYYFALIELKTKQRELKTPHEIVQSLIRAMLLDFCFLLQDKEGIVNQQKLSQGKILFNRFINHLSKSEIKRLPITHYASGLAITPKYLTMLCLKYSNKTASQWIIEYTIEDIRFYLRSSNLSIKEISAKLGFANMSHFGSYVRKHLGMSPSEFREH
ncbi:MAG: AraC family transcriptional regulator [Prevotella sp.]|nr:AraC family transcriptional regulator [Prevotella sp.]